MEKNPKPQPPNFRFQNAASPREEGSPDFPWSLKLGASLEFGIWNLELMRSRATFSENPLLLNSHSWLLFSA
jgi:hypothetical protein